RLRYSSKRPPTPAASTLSLHDALPISRCGRRPRQDRRQLPDPITSPPSRIPRGACSQTPEIPYPEENSAGGGNLDLPHRSHLPQDRKSTRLNSSHVKISYAVFCLKKKK